MRNDTDFTNLYFQFQYKMKSSNFSESPEKYLNQYELEIWLETEDGSPIELAGKGDLYNILLSAALEEDADIFEIFDFDAGLLDLGNTLYDFENVDFKKCIFDYYNDDFYNPNVFFINRIELLPRFRGQGLGEKIIQDICHRFASGCGLFALKAFPLQMERRAIETPKEWDKRMKFHQLEQDEEKATYKLYSYYQNLGFHNILKDDFFFMRPPYYGVY